MTDEDAVRALSALANSHRIAVFRALVRCGPDGLAVGELAGAVPIAPSTLTFHLKELERAGLIRSWRNGRFVRSALSVDVMRDLISFLTDDCCAGRPDLCGAAAEPVRSEDERRCTPLAKMKGRRP